ncbi:AMP-dependent synthetase and ligase [Anaeromyxobacter dehalogenans 2CP-1]|uniref:AMP-dependent synthetase and ligase n=1 Tax=Anaeromyxobacter dehalogenans (strain ATCC BAA-258 / DSM 21875 / 2CP-1) TaxID=455488 RepID=B8JE72_ANAD2|nr:AMP-binding protein [Anaeromyxobacter dehalogenans]ACL66137.1 AMP-dependent synthetase and ligase [Anaeromyxobacter dehalogenans 2CP-1]
MSSTDVFRRARDFLVTHREDYETAYREFRWPVLDRFNWALDWFDMIADGNGRTALHIIEDYGAELRLSYVELAERSNRVATYLRRHGVERGHRVLMMLPNCVQIWEVMLASMKLGACVIPATSLLTPEDVQDRIERGRVGHVITDAAGTEKFRVVNGSFTRHVVGEAVPGWMQYEDAYDEGSFFLPHGETLASDPVLLYFTSGTTAKPKLVVHTHKSYPVGHLSTMYWIGLREGDKHLNVSSPGWAKHAWSSFFAPFNAGATVCVYNYARFSAARTLEVLARHQITTLCAPPTVWRMLILEDLAKHPVKLRELLSAGEPLNPEVIEKVRQAWGITIRDGYGQTETTCQIGNSPGQPLKPGSMGRPLPGYRIALLDEEGRPAPEEGEICIDLEARPASLMAGYEGDANLNDFVTRHGHYHTGDVATRDEEGYITYVGRSDDVFKSSDYRISPFELESALIEHDAVAEAAVVPSPDAVRGLLPKAFIILKPGRTPDRELALEIFRFLRRRLAPYKRIRRVEFSELPKTVSGKIRRVELRRREQARAPSAPRGPLEFWQEDFPELAAGEGR